MSRKRHRPSPSQRGRAPQVITRYVYAEPPATLRDLVETNIQLSQNRPGKPPAGPSYGSDPDDVAGRQTPEKTLRALKPAKPPAPGTPAGMTALTAGSAGLSPNGQPSSARGDNGSPVMAPSSANVNAWGWQGNQSKPIPQMPEESPTRPDLSMYGASGTAILSGLITSDEYNPDLLTPLDRADVYNKMRLDHAPVKALLTAITQPLLRAQWSIEPAGGDTSKDEDQDDGSFGSQQLREHPHMRLSERERSAERQTMRQLFAERPRSRLLAHRMAWQRHHLRFDELSDDQSRNIEIAAFVDSCLFDDMVYTSTEGQVLRQSWDDILRHILLMYPFGFSTFEVCYRIEDGWTKWSKWTPLLPRTIFRWWPGADNELAGIQQWTFRNWRWEYVDIPAGKLLRFTREQEGSNFEGISLLRAAYKHFLYATGFEQIEAVAVERQSVVPPVIRLPEGFTASDLSAAYTIVRNIRANQQTGVVIPQPWEFEYPKNQARYAAQALPAIQHHNTQILAAALMDWLSLGQGPNGSYALADVRARMVEQVIQADAKLIEEVVNTAIRKLVDYNFEGVSVYPTLKCSKISMSDATMYAQALSQLVQAQLIHPSDVLEDALLDAFGLPKGAPSQVASQNPGSPNTPNQAENADTAGEDDQGDMQDANADSQRAAAAGIPNDGTGDNGTGGDSNTGAGQFAEAREVPPTDPLAPQHDTLFVACYVPQDTAQDLAIARDTALTHLPGDPTLSRTRPAEMHITLAMLEGHVGDAFWTPDAVHRLRRVVLRCASQYAPLLGTLAPDARTFPPSPSSDGHVPLYAAVNSPALVAFRQYLVETLTDAGFPVDTTFPDYTPHVTLAYLALPGDGAGIAVPALRLALNTLTVGVGDATSTYLFGTDDGTRRNLPTDIPTDVPTVTPEAAPALSDTQLLMEVLTAIRGADVVERAYAFAGLGDEAEAGL